MIVLVLPGRQTLLPLCVFLLLSFSVAGCTNPFAPALGEIGEDIWDEQDTIGGLLRNFRMSYLLQDSLRYSDLIADEFVFQYYDQERQEYDQWDRAIELKATGGMMSALNHLDLRWGSWSTSLDTFSRPDTTVEFAINFSLSVGEFPPVSGFARFETKKGEDGRFRLVSWRDDF